MRNTKPKTNLNLITKIETFRKLDMARKQLCKSLESLKKEITDEMGESTEAFDMLGNVIATYIFVEGTHFDKKAFELAYPGELDHFEELKSEFETPKFSRRFETK
jgi:hypothetical protein